MKQFNLRNLLVVTGVTCLLFTGGCATDGEFGDRTAVVIYNQEPEKIIDATTQVFSSKGFNKTSSSDTEVVFERKGTLMQNMAYGSWMEGSIWEKATLIVEPYGKGASLLEAKVDRVSNKNDEFFAETKSLSKRARKPYQEILDQIANMLSGFPAVDNGN